MLYLITNIILTSNEGDSHGGSVSVIKSNSDSMRAAIGPVRFGDSVTWLSSSIG